MFKGCEVQRLPPRDRIIEAARDLFRKHGFRGIGVDAIAEAANTNKMTLYRHFGSKDDLIIACLREVAAEFEAAWDEVDKAHLGDPMGQLHAWVLHVFTYATGDNRGCDIANAAIELTGCEHPARKFIEQFKSSHRDRLASLCRSAGIAQPEVLADALLLLLEGARVNLQIMGPEGPGARFIQISQAVIASFCESNVKAAFKLTVSHP